MPWICRVDTARPRFRMPFVPPREAAHFIFRRIPLERTSTAVTTHLLPTYARVDLAFERGEGAWLVSTSNERYLDFSGGVAVNVLGHAHPHLLAALNQQAQKVWHVSNLYPVPHPQPLPHPLCPASLP